MKKKLLLAVLSAFMLLTTIPAMVFADDVVENSQVVEAVEDNDKLQINCTLYFVASKNGSIDIDKPITVPFGTTYEIDGDTITFTTKDGDVTVVAIADDGYFCKQWYVEPPYNNDGVIYSDTLFVAKFSEIVAQRLTYDDDYNEYTINYDNLFDALDDCGTFDFVVLCKDLYLKEDVHIDYLKVLDLNHHKLHTLGKIVNEGSLVLYNENADIVNYLLFDVQGTYSAGEDLYLPNKDNPYCIIPEGAFFYSGVEKNPYSHELSMALFDKVLTWNGDVQKGTQLLLNNDLALGGNIIAPNTEFCKDTLVQVQNVTLTDDITIGSNDKDAGLATLYIESYDSIDGSRYIGSLNANGHKITLNLTGIVVTNSDAKFDENNLVSGIDGMVIERKYDAENDTNTYLLAKEHHYINEEFRIKDTYTGTLEFVTNGEYENDVDVTVKVDGKVIDPSNYDLSHGSIHVTLHSDFIKNLSAGKHKMVIAADGYKTISQYFTIEDTTRRYIAPKTGA